MNRTLLQSWQGSSWPTIKSSKPLETGEGIIDQRTFNTIEELRNNTALKEQLGQIVQQAAPGEKNFYLPLFGEFLGTFGTARKEHEIEGISKVSHADRVAKKIGFSKQDIDNYLADNQ